MTNRFNYIPEKRSSLQVLLLTLAVAGSILFILTYITLGIATPGYSSLYNTISSLELTKSGWLQQANFIIFGIFSGCFSVALINELTPGINAVLIILFQSITAIGLIGDGIFIYEPMHTIFDIITFNSVLLVLIFFAGQFYKNTGWEGWSLYSIITAILMMVLFAAFGYANSHNGTAGLYERIAFLPRTAWSIIFIPKLLRGKKLKRLRS